jgi:hypothetical protein
LILSSYSIHCQCVIQYEIPSLSVFNPTRGENDKQDDGEEGTEATKLQTDEMRKRVTGSLGLIKAINGDKPIE